MVSTSPRCCEQCEWTIAAPGRASLFPVVVAGRWRALDGVTFISKERLIIPVASLHDPRVRPGARMLKQRAPLISKSGVAG